MILKVAIQNAVIHLFKNRYIKRQCRIDEIERSPPSMAFLWDRDPSAFLIQTQQRILNMIEYEIPITESGSSPIWKAPEAWCRRDRTYYELAHSKSEVIIKQITFPESYDSICFCNDLQEYGFERIL